MPEWNKPEGVGAYVLKRRRGTMPADQAVAAYLTIMADNTIDVFDAHVNERMDDETARWRLDVNVRTSPT
jgi:hypothetical protein